MVNAGYSIAVLPHQLAFVKKRGLPHNTESRAAFVMDCFPQWGWDRLKSGAGTSNCYLGNHLDGVRDFPSRATPLLGAGCCP